MQAVGAPLRLRRVCSGSSPVLAAFRPDDSELAIDHDSRMNVTDDEFRTYIDLFHSTLDATAEEYLSADTRRKLLHTSLTPARIVGYVSTQFGVAIEYLPSSALEIVIRHGSARVSQSEM